MKKENDKNSQKSLLPNLPSSEKGRIDKKYSKQPTFIGLDEILKCLIAYSHESYKGTKSQQERFLQIKRSLLGTEPKDGKSGRKSIQTEYGSHISSFYITVAKDIVADCLAEREEIIKSKSLSDIEKVKLLSAVRDNLPTSRYIKKHIHMVVGEKQGGREKLIDNLTESYNEDGRIYENPDFLRKQETEKPLIDKEVFELLEKNSQKRQVALNEVLECLRKHNWPI